MQLVYCVCAEILSRMCEQDGVELIAGVPVVRESAQIVPDAVGASQDVPPPRGLTQIVREPVTNVDLLSGLVPHLQGTQELVHITQHIHDSIADQQHIPEAQQVFSVTTQSASERADSDMSDYNNLPQASGWNYRHEDKVNNDSAEGINKVHNKRTTDDVREAESDANVILSASFANMSVEDADMDSRCSSISHYSCCSDAQEEDLSVGVSGYTAAFKGDVGNTIRGFRNNNLELATTRSSNFTLSMRYMQSSSTEDTVFTTQLSENFDVSSSSRQLPSMLEDINSAAADLASNEQDVSTLSDTEHGNSSSSDSALGVSVSSDSVPCDNSTPSGTGMLFNAARGMSSDSTFDTSMPLDDATATPVGMEGGESQSSDIPNDIISKSANT